VTVAGKISARIRDAGLPAQAILNVLRCVACLNLSDHTRSFAKNLFSGTPSLRYAMPTTIGVNSTRAAPPNTLDRLVSPRRFEEDFNLKRQNLLFVTLSQRV
jgi:hypothetical protein